MSSKRNQKRPKGNPYRCPACGRTYYSKDTRQWRMSFCEDTGRNVRMQLVAPSKLVLPVGMARAYLDPGCAPYRMRVLPDANPDFDEAVFYKGRKKVWSCNTTFADKHFVEWDKKTK
jgi:hypothetical protein